MDYPPNVNVWIAEVVAPTAEPVEAPPEIAAELPAAEGVGAGGVLKWIFIKVAEEVIALLIDLVTKAIVDGMKNGSHMKPHLNYDPDMYGMTLVWPDGSVTPLPPNFYKYLQK